MVVAKAGADHYHEHLGRLRPEVDLELPIERFDLLDGSVGIHWAKFREGKPWAGERIRYRRGVPALGEHTAEILLEAGYDNDEIAALAAAGTVRLR